MNDMKSRFATEPPAPPPSQPLPAKPDGAQSRPKAADMPVLQPFLRRSDTEKPLALMTNGNMSASKPDSNVQMTSLREALQTTQRELTTQTERLKDMEETLRLEREARNSAEKRADRLDGSSSSSSSPPAPQPETDDDDANTPKDTIRQLNDADDASTIHERFDVMRVEMDNMRTQVEKYRQRAEAAEQKSQHDRQTLSEMIESIRDRDNAVRRRKEARAAAKRGSPNGSSETLASQENAAAGAASRQHTADSPEGAAVSVDESSEPELDEDDNEYILNDDGFKTKLNGHAHHLPLPPYSHLDGTTIHTLLPALTNPDPSKPAAFAESLRSLTPSQLDELDRTIRTVRSALQPSSPEASANALTTAHNEAAKAWGMSAPLTQEQLVQGAPFASMLSVVLLGVGLMAWINGWTPVRPER